ncbi:MAG TPA: phytanoyl-CoA dioxygenase family protein [Tepidisphaeraceae bacterium]|nr:phytanoyl-CoA dioxygenase family protein [Tepidisphaeraceae bacterium]
MTLAADLVVAQQPAPPKPADVDIDSPYTVTPQHLASFRENGFVKLKDVLSPQAIAYYRAEISAKVKELNTNMKPMSERDTYGRAFLQVMNIWLKSPVVREFVFGRRLAKIAADLLEVDGVRLYHDQALYKEAGGGYTPWHADQYYWPLATDRTVTAWIPLQATPPEMGPLCFAAKSQNMAFGRDLEISDTSEQQLSDALKREGYAVEESPFDLGEVSFHLGWNYHRAGPNTSGRPREVMTIIYMDQNMRVMEPKHAAQKSDLRNWLTGLKPGDAAASPLNPVLYSRR